MAQCGWSQVCCSLNNASKCAAYGKEQGGTFLCAPDFRNSAEVWGGRIVSLDVASCNHPGDDSTKVSFFLFEFLKKFL